MIEHSTVLPAAQWACTTEARQTLERPRIARTALVEGPKSLKFEQSDALIPRVGCVVLVSGHISGRYTRRTNAVAAHV